MDSCHRTLMYNVKAQTTTFQDVCKNSESVKLFPSFILIANWLKYLYHTELDNNNCKHLSNSQVSRNTTHRKLIFFKCWRQIHCIWLFHSSIKGMWYRWFPCKVYQTAHVRFQSSHEPKMVAKKIKIQIYINEDAMSSACRSLTLSKDFEVPVCARGQTHPWPLNDLSPSANQCRLSATLK